MTFPAEQPVIDLMMGIPGEDNSQWYEFIKPLLMDQESRELFQMPAQYMFKDIPQSPEGEDDYIAYTVQQMDHYNIEKSLTGVSEISLQAVERFPDRFLLDLDVDPNKGMEEVRKIKQYHEKYQIASVGAFPAGKSPQVPINDKRWYPIYAACVELDLPINVCCGVPGPRVPLACQHVELIDEVVWFFPELKFVMRHGGEPWADLAVMLMLKYPNLHYMTSAYSPKYYPKEIIHFANTRGSNQVMYAGYFPMGLSLEKIFSELKQLELKESVWPKFLYENAKRVYKL